MVPPGDAPGATHPYVEAPGSGAGGGAEHRARYARAATRRLGHRHQQRYGAAAARAGAAGPYPLRIMDERQARQIGGAQHGHCRLDGRLHRPDRRRRGDRGGLVPRRRARPRGGRRRLHRRPRRAAAPERTAELGAARISGRARRGRCRPRSLHLRAVVPRHSHGRQCGDLAGHAASPPARTARRSARASIGDWGRARTRTCTGA